MFKFLSQTDRIQQLSIDRLEALAEALLDFTQLNDLGELVGGQSVMSGRSEAIVTRLTACLRMAPCCDRIMETLK